MFGRANCGPCVELVWCVHAHDSIPALSIGSTSRLSIFGPPLPSITRYLPQEPFVAMVVVSVTVRDGGLHPLQACKAWHLVEMEDSQSKSHHAPDTIEAQGPPLIILNQELRAVGSAGRAGIVPCLYLVL